MTAYQQFNDKWHLSGCRPANQPKRRLKQYAEWLSNGRTDWPDAIHRGSSALPRGGDSERLSASRVRKRRQEYGFTKHEEDWRTFFTPGVGGTRFHTWMTDGLIPLDQATLAAQSDHFSTWFLWPVGDVPDRIKSTLQTLEVTGPGRPLCNGWAQGIIRMLEPDYIPERGE